LDRHEKMDIARRNESCKTKEQSKVQKPGSALPQEIKICSRGCEI
jgi:hypothetical protein